MTGFGPGQPEVGSTGRVEYSQYVKVPLSSIYSWPSARNREGAGKGRESQAGRVRGKGRDFISKSRIPKTIPREKAGKNQGTKA